MTRARFTDEFNEEAVKQVIDHAELGLHDDLFMSRFKSSSHISHDNMPG